ncbi:hydantoinase/oxoprolinase family protein [Actinacidiphila oryziradicis]|uniref:Hydantoinase/oxoprolinase family protein n=1 Tax=Actinacidiphila oryziradicis TaxID=2571141 RepID=A0A4U0RTR2_9ACTN|nr:hydantoinase/oxoprolinase family protein [Actinacidiphila oryziradicis]TJZ98872.1 hydantoinase/oxoprolinase family protein [Actinacidiphila oryziradicis]
MSYALGIDVGGTFTDAVASDGAGRIVSAKTPTTPPHREIGVMRAIEDIAGELSIGVGELLSQTDYIAHGTTASINALVQGTVADVGLIATKGHRDAIYIMNAEGRTLGRAAHEIQDTLRQRKPVPLIPKRRALEVTERIDHAGKVLVPLDEDEVRGVARSLVDQGVEAIAVCLLWSFKNGAHEQRVRELIHEIAPDMYVTLSSEVSPRIREFARTSTTIMNAQIGPRLRMYLTPLQKQLEENGLKGPLLVMQSEGGTITADRAPEHAITTIGSVLSGGVIGGMRMAEQLGHRNVITTDVGGTTFLAGLIVDGEPVMAPGSIVNQFPINAATIRVHTIGSGGGALASVDAGGNLRLGPQSAEAVPGPACYGNGGTRPTNTDANLVLGILSPHGLLGGRKPLQMDLARQAIREHVAEPLGLTVEEAAIAIHEVQNAQAGDLLRRAVVQAGYDPRDFVAYAFGGAGPAHCAGYCQDLGVREVVVPLGPVASAFSAYGLAASDIVLSAELSDPSSFPVEHTVLESHYARLEADLQRALDRQKVKFQDVTMQREVDLRYSMQVNELATTIPDGEFTERTGDEILERFEEQYERINGSGAGYREAGVQAITYRARAKASLDFPVILPDVAQATGSDPAEALLEERHVCLDSQTGFVLTPVYDYARLRAGHEITGPAVVDVPTTVVVVPAGVTGRVDRLGNLVLSYQ